MFEKITASLANATGDKLASKILSELPNTISEKDKAQSQQAIANTIKAYQLELVTIVEQEKQAVQAKAHDTEGTSINLNQYGFIGKFFLLMRNIQRTIWAYFVLVLDIMIFSGTWQIPNLSDSANNLGIDLASIFWIINFLVLGFLFGERALLNVLPIVKDINSKKNN